MIGNLGSDAVIKEFPDKKVINFSLAHNERRVDEDGVVTEKTTWVNCSMWRKLNQSTEVAKYLTKGQQVYVEGLPSVTIYRDSTGEHRPDFRVMVKDLKLIGNTGERA